MRTTERLDMRKNLRIQSEKIFLFKIIIYSIYLVC